MSHDQNKLGKEHFTELALLQVDSIHAQQREHDKQYRD